jgi:hypothetical protein
MIFMPKIPESLLHLLSAFMIHMFVAFIYCLGWFALGTIVPEPYIGDFQDQLFDESQFLFEDQQGKCPLTNVLPCSLYSVDVELHDRSKHCATFAMLTSVD